LDLKKNFEIFFLIIIFFSLVLPLACVVIAIFFCFSPSIHKNK
jgi:hypothetical protein